MQDTTDARQAKDFMTTAKRAIFILSLGLLLIHSSCGDDNTNQQSFIPDVPVSITINTDLPSYYHLKNLGGFEYLDGGYRGVLLIHNFDDLYYAIERTCSFESDKECAHIFVDSMNFQLMCGQYVDTGFVECCASKFTFDGNVLEPPAQLPLKLYRVTPNGGLLTISN